MWLKLTGRNGKAYFVSTEGMLCIQSDDSDSGSMIRFHHDKTCHVTESPEAIAAMLGAGGSDPQTTINRLCDEISKITLSTDVARITREAWYAMLSR